MFLTAFHKEPFFLPLVKIAIFAQKDYLQFVFTLKIVIPQCRNFKIKIGIFKFISHIFAHSVPLGAILSPICTMAIFTVYNLFPQKIVSFYVKFGIFKSTSHEIRYAIPQGAILSPICKTAIFAQFAHAQLLTTCLHKQNNISYEVGLFKS
jgi:hypothetical protein